MSQAERTHNSIQVRQQQLDLNKQNAQRILENLRASLTRNIVSTIQVKSYNGI